MSDQQFVNAYIRILNETINEAMNKNLVLQAQLEVSRQTCAKVTELEEKVKELSNLSSENDMLRVQANNLRAQLDQSSLQLNNKNSHVETFKRELIEARNIIKNLNAEIETLNNEKKELKTRKKKKEKAANVDTVESALVVENDLISISETF